MGYSWMAHLLPHLDRSHLYQNIDFSRVYTGGRHPVATEIVPTFLCPTDGAPSQGPSGCARNSYTGNSGTGVLDHGFNGLFQDACPDCGASWPGGPVRLGDVTDGLSNTAMVSEHLMGIGTADIGRIIWNLDGRYKRLSDLKSACLSETPRFQKSGKAFGDPWSHGTCWLEGQPGHSWYNHVFVPMKPSCFNGTGVPEGIHSNASNHSGGVYLLMAGGNVQFISVSIDELVWIALGSRNAAETTPLPP